MSNRGNIYVPLIMVGEEWEPIGGSIQLSDALSESLEAAADSVAIINSEIAKFRFSLNGFDLSQTLKALSAIRQKENAFKRSQIRSRRNTSVKRYRHGRTQRTMVKNGR